MWCMWKKVTINYRLYIECRKRTHGRCTKWKKVTSALAEDFVCKRCKMTRSEMRVVRLNDDVKTVEGFCNFRNALDAGVVLK